MITIRLIILTITRTIVPIMAISISVVGSNINNNDINSTE